MRLLLLILSLVSSLSYAEDNTIFVSNGKTIANSVLDTRSRAWGVDEEVKYDFGTIDYGYMNEGHQPGIKRDGIYAQYLFSGKFSDRIETSFAIGPYYNSITEVGSNGQFVDAYNLALMPSVGLTYNISEEFKLRWTWNHTMFTANNKDTDVLLFSLGYKPKR